MDRVTLVVRSSRTLNQLAVMEHLPTEDALSLVSEWVLNGALGELTVEVLPGRAFDTLRSIPFPAR